MTVPRKECPLVGELTALRDAGMAGAEDALLIIKDIRSEYLAPGDVRLLGLLLDEIRKELRDPGALVVAGGDQADCAICAALARRRP